MSKVNGVTLPELVKNYEGTMLPVSLNQVSGGLFACWTRLDVKENDV